MVMGKIFFKNVGTTLEEAKITASSIETTKTVFGIKTPLRLGTDFLFETTATLPEQIGDNLRNLILTNHGERLSLFNYGANLKSILSDFNSQEEFDAAAAQKIKSAVSNWMPYVVLKDFISEQNAERQKMVKIIIVYDVPALKIVNHSVVVNLVVQ